MHRPTEPLTHGQRRRREILDTAVDLSSAEGLAGLTIGRLADAIGISKSGLFAHFGAKEALQLAAIDHAAEDFEARVIAPGDASEPGLARLEALLEAWLVYVDEGAYRGGCFFFASSSEFGSRPGAVRDRLARISRAWRQSLEREARVAQRQGELSGRCDPAQLAFQLHALVLEANWVRELLAEPAAFARARAGIQAALAAWVPSPPDSPARTRAPRSGSKRSPRKEKRR